MLLGRRSKRRLPAAPRRDGNVTVAVAWQTPVSPWLALPTRDQLQTGTVNGGPWGEFRAGLAETRSSPCLAPAPTSTQPLFLFTRPGILLALKNVFANSFALTSRLSHLLSPAAPAGQGLRAHPAPRGSSPRLLPELPQPRPLGPRCLWPQLSFVLTGNEKQEEGVGSEALQGSPGCQRSLGCVPACIPAIWHWSPAGPVHPPACLGRRKWELAGTSPPSTSSVAPSLGCRVTPLPWGPAGRAGPPVPPWHAGPLLASSPTDLPRLRVFSHV